MSTAARDAVIVGAGLAGSGLAAGLADRGWDVLLVEKDQLPRHKVCGEFLSPESQSSLRTLKLTDQVAALSPAAITQAQLTMPSGHSLAVTLPGTAWGISRYALDAALAQGARQLGASLALGTTVSGYESHARGYRIQLRQGRERRWITARTLFFACGRHSKGNLPPHGDLPPRSQIHVGVKCHYQDIFLGEKVGLYFFPGGYCGVNRVEGARANVCLLASYDSFAQAGGTVFGMIQQVGCWNPALGRLLRSGRPLLESTCTVAAVDTARRAVPWTDAPCLGDTAAMIPPLCGDGMAMALRSAEICLPLAHDYLRGAMDRDGWAHTYSRAWHGEFDGRLRTGRLLQRLLGVSWLSIAAIALGNWLPALPHYLVRATRGAGY